MTSWLGWQNRVLTGVLTVGSSASGLDAGQLQDDHGATASAWQTVSGVLTEGAGATLTIDSGSNSTTWRLFGLFRTNLTVGAEVRWRVSNTADFSAQITYNSGSRDGVQAGIGQHVVVAPSEVQGRYARAFINDAGNPDGFVNIPLAYAGPGWAPGAGVAWDAQLGYQLRESEFIARGGQQWNEPLSNQRFWDVTLQTSETAELWASMMEAARYARTGGNLLFVPDDAGADLMRDSVFGRLATLSDVTLPFRSLRHRALRVRVLERL
jgi:hypothetical protein